MLCLLIGDGIDAVPVAWVVGGLWLVTVTLAGALGRSINGRLGEIMQSVEAIASVAKRLETEHAVLTERVKSHGRAIDVHARRLDRIERLAPPHRHEHAGEGESE